MTRRAPPLGGPSAPPRGVGRANDELPPPSEARGDGHLRRTPLLCLLRAKDAHESVRQQRQSDVPVPSISFPDLVLVQAKAVFGFLKARLYSPAGSRYPHQFL